MTWQIFPNVTITNGSKNIVVNDSTATAGILAGYAVNKDNKSYEIESITSSAIILVDAWAEATTANVKIKIQPTSEPIKEYIQETLGEVKGLVADYLARLQLEESIISSTGTVPFTDSAGVIHNIPGWGNLGSIASKDIEHLSSLHSSRNFPNGTLVKTDLAYPDSGDAWMLEITGNSYGDNQPFDVRCQGYIYNGSMIKCSGISNGAPIAGMVVFSYEGSVCFWWPYIEYWQGFNVRFISTMSQGYQNNRVLSISDEVKPPTSTKEVSIPIEQSWHTANSTVDGNGFIKNASPIVKIFTEVIEPNELAKGAFLTKNGIGDYIITGTLGFAKSGWYIETPKDANGNVKVFVEYEQLEDNSLQINTYQPDYSMGSVVAGSPMDIPEGRWIDLRLEEPEKSEEEDREVPID